MGIEIPGALQWVAEYVVGAGDWPDGDETAMRRLADAWTGMATSLDEVDEDATQLINEVLASIEGSTGEAIKQFWEKTVGKGGLPGLIEFCNQLADTLEDGANDIEHTKYTIIAALVIFAAEMAFALAQMATGVGAATGAATAAAARVSTQIAIRIAIRQLLARIATRAAAKMAAKAALKGAFWGIVEEGGIDLGARLVQVARGDREMTAKDWKDVGVSALGGAVGGAVSGGLGTDGLGKKVTDSVDDGAKKWVTSAAVGTSAELASGVSAAAATAAATGEEFQFGLGDITSSAVGGVQGASSRGDGGDAAPGPGPGPEYEDGGGGRPETDSSGTDSRGDGGGPERPGPETGQGQPGPDRNGQGGGGPSDQGPGTPSPPPPQTSQHEQPQPPTQQQAPGTPSHTDPTHTPDSSQQTTPQAQAPGASSHTDPPHPGAPQQPTDPTQPQTSDSSRYVAPQQDSGPAPSQESPPHQSDPAHARTSDSSHHAVPQQQSGPAPSQESSPHQSDPAAQQQQDPTAPRSTESSQQHTPSAQPQSTANDPTSSPTPRESIPDSVPSQRDSAPDASPPGEPSVPRDSIPDSVPPQRDSVPDAPPWRDPTHEVPRVDGSPGSGAPTPADGRPAETTTAAATTTAPPTSASTPGSFAPSGVGSQDSARPAAVDPSQSAAQSGAPGRGQPQRAEGPTPAMRADVRDNPPNRPAQPDRRTVAPQPTHFAPSRPDRDGPARPHTPTRSGAPQAGSPSSVRHAAQQVPHALSADAGHRSGTPARTDRSDRHTSPNPQRPTYQAPSPFDGPTQRVDVPTQQPSRPEPVAPQHRDEQHDRSSQEAYDRFRSNNADVEAITSNTSDYERSDGRKGYTAEEIAQIKSHLMRDEHLFRDANGNETFRRLDPDPAVADAWTRLAEGNPSPSDLTLLDRSLAEANFLIRDPYATYDQARNQAASRVADFTSHEPSDGAVAQGGPSSDTRPSDRQEPQKDQAAEPDRPAPSQSQPERHNDQPTDADQLESDSAGNADAATPRANDERHESQSPLYEDDAPPPDDDAPPPDDGQRSEPHDDDAPPVDDDSALQDHRGPEALPADLRQIYDDSTPTPAGRAFYDPTDTRMQNAATQITPDPGRYTVDVHTNQDHAVVGGRRVTATELASMIRSDSNYDGSPIRLIGCEAGRRPDGFASQLARELGVDVTAPTTRVSNTRDGRPLATDSYIDQDGVRRRVHPPNGEWNTFRPDGTSDRLSDNGYIPSADQSVESQATAPGAGDGDRPESERATTHDYILSDGSHYRTTLADDQVSSTDSFSRNLAANLADSNSGLTQSQFDRLRREPVANYSPADAANIRAIRDTVNVSNGDVVQRALTAEVAYNYLTNATITIGGTVVHDPAAANGFTSRYCDVSHLRSVREIVEGLALTYSDPGYVGRNHRPPYEVSDQVVVTLRFPLGDAGHLDVPYGGNDSAGAAIMGGRTINAAPFTGNGFTLSPNEPVPEFMLDRIGFDRVAEIWAHDVHGNQILLGAWDAPSRSWLLTSDGSVYISDHHNITSGTAGGPALGFRAGRDPVDDIVERSAHDSTASVESGSSHGRGEGEHDADASQTRDGDQAQPSAEAFENQLPEMLEEELRNVDEAGIVPTRVGSSEFDDIINSDDPSIKWALLSNGELIAVPMFHRGDEIPHTALTRGESVVSAGQADIAGSSQTGYFGATISNHSGHYVPTANSLDLAIEAFGRLGIEFPDEGVERH